MRTINKRDTLHEYVYVGASAGHSDCWLFTRLWAILKVKEMNSLLSEEDKKKVQEAIDMLSNLRGSPTTPHESLSVQSSRSTDSTPNNPSSNPSQASSSTGMLKIIISKYRSDID